MGEGVREREEGGRGEDELGLGLIPLQCKSIGSKIMGMVGCSMKGNEH